MENSESRVAQHFDKYTAQWDAHYRDAADITRYEVLRRRQLTGQALSRLINQPDALLIEAGCGTGRVISEILEHHPGWQGLGLDISENMVEACQAAYSNPHLRFQQHDIEDSPLPVQADAIFALGVLCYLHDPYRAIDHIHSMLNTGGVFIFSANKPSLPGAITSFYRQVRFRQQGADELCTTAPLKHTSQALDGKFAVLETYDYCYLPYVPLLRRMMWLARMAESVFGRRPSLLSLTTLFVTRKI